MTTAGKHLSLLLDRESLMASQMSQARQPCGRPGHAKPLCLSGHVTCASALNQSAFGDKVPEAQAWGEWGRPGGREGLGSTYPKQDPSLL